MKNYKILALIVCAVINLSWLSPVHGNEDPPVFVGVDTMYPYLYQDEEGMKGPIYTLVTTIFRRMGIPVKMELYSFPLVLRYLKEGSVDGTFMIYKNKEREAFLLFSDLMLRNTSIQVYVRRGREFDFQTVKDLYGKRVGNRTDFFISEEFSRAVKQHWIVLDEAREVPFNLKKLMSDRIDCYVGDIGLTSHFIDEMELNDKVVDLPTPLVPETFLYMALSKRGRRIRDKEKFLKELNRVIHEVQDDGTLERIADEVRP